MHNNYNIILRHSAVSVTLDQVATTVRVFIMKLLIPYLLLLHGSDFAVMYDCSLGMCWRNIIIIISLLLTSSIIVVSRMYTLHIPHAPQTTLSRC